MDYNKIARAIKTPVTLLLLAVLVYAGARWGWDAVREPIPPRPPDPCVVQEFGPQLKPENVYLQVFNGSKSNGLAKRYGSLLSADGFKVLKRVNADNTNYEASVVIGYAENSPEVVLVRQVLADVEFRADGRTDRTVDVIIGSRPPRFVENPKLTVPLPEGTACLPKHRPVDVNG